MKITDVAGLEALHPSTPMTAGKWDRLVYGGALIADIRGGRRLDECLPAEVLSPRTVTPEQVEAGARATYERSTPASLVSWGDAPDHVRKAHRINVRAALAAMGIEVSDG